MMLCCGGTAHAQSGDPKNFFDQGFAAGGGLDESASEEGESAEDNGEEPSIGRDSSSAPDDPEDEGSPNAFGEQRPKEKKKQDLEALAPVPTPEGKSVLDLKSVVPAGEKVRYIGLIINPLDEKHFEQYYRELGLLALNHRFAIGTVYTVGPTPIQVDRKDLVTVSMHGGKVKRVESLPEKYKQAKRSPTWIIGTPKGEILLDGIPSIEPYINDRDEFVVPQDLGLTRINEDPPDSDEAAEAGTAASDNQ